MKYSVYEQIQCVEREIKMRKLVFPRRVAEHKMDRHVADREIETMECVLETLRQAECKEGLFADE